MRIVIIGATGHVGGYLVPRLVADGHDVVAITRGTSAPYRDDPAIEKGRRLLGYAPAHSSLSAVAESVEWLRQAGRLGDGVPPVQFG